MTPMTPDYTGSGNSLFGSYRAAPLNVHVNHAGVGALAGHGVTPGVTPQTAANTVVIGQKVDAVFKYDPMLALDTGTLRWSEPTGGGFVRSYTANGTIGLVEPLTLQHRTGAALNFYYTGKSANVGSVICSVNGNNGIWLTNPNEYVHYITASASFYIEKPSVTSFSSAWAFGYPTPGAQYPIGIRKVNANGPDALVLGGILPGQQDLTPGITWTANVNAPPIIGGGHIGYNNQISVITGRWFSQGIAKEKVKAEGLGYMLDMAFPYSGSVVSAIPAPVHTNNYEKSDTPHQFLNPHPSLNYDKFKVSMSFKTYLIYKPEGPDTDTIWVTLEVIEWGWHATALYNGSTWGLDSIISSVSGGGNGTPSSFLPEWDKNYKDYRSFVFI